MGSPIQQLPGPELHNFFLIFIFSLFFEGDHKVGGKSDIKSAKILLHVNTRKQEL